MIRAGAYRAVNLDGGGSTALIHRGHLLNRPYDGQDRPTVVPAGRVTAMDIHFPGFAEHHVREAVTAIAAGRPAVVVDDVDREDEGDLIFAAACATPELVAFTVRHTSGFVCVALPDDECDRLALPPMHHRNGDRFGTAYRVTVDLRGTGTGISASDRARTIAALASSDSVARDCAARARRPADGAAGWRAPQAGSHRGRRRPRSPRRAAGGRSAQRDRVAGASG
jgi:hypothetical protein